MSARRSFSEVKAEALSATMPVGQVVRIPDDLLDSFAEVELKESPSSIRNYLSCPLYWYVERYAPIDGEVDPPNYNKLIGNFVHRIMEVFFSEPKSERSHELLDTIFRTGIDAIKQGNLKTGIIEPGLQSEFEHVKVTAPKPLSEGGWGFDGMTPDKVVGSFYNRSAECIRNAKAFFPRPESMNVISTETWGRITINDILIRMKIDLIEDSPTGVIVGDHKTGKAPDKSNDDDEMECLRDSDGNPILDTRGNPILLLAEAYIAMGIYALAVKMGGVEGVDPVTPRSVKMFYLKESVIYAARVRNEHLDLVKSMLNEVTESMSEIQKTGEIIASPSDEPDDDGDLQPSGSCFHCPIVKLCPARDGRNGSWDDLREELVF